METFDKESGKAIADVLTTIEEMIDESQPYELFDPECTWKKKNVTNFSAIRLLQRIFANGNCVYNSPELSEIRSYCKEQIDTLRDEVKRFENPHKYSVNLSKPLWEMKERLIREYKLI